ncbi:MAG: alpha-hydroxy-acid oxidizing protein, partial [Actinomycetia bacterium]|nr:alpha-hydroxy-acid oxidizing protein [Actinomycetes bacterium]
HEDGQRLGARDAHVDRPCARVARDVRHRLPNHREQVGDERGGQRGVEKAVEILTGEITRTLQLIGVNSVDELRASHVRLRPNG